jgi:RNA polymerase sigma factor (sigma-70 family)
MRDKEIIECMREGDFSYVYGTLYEVCLGYVYNRGWSKYIDFDDVFQNTVIILNEKIVCKDFNLTSKLSTFFIGIFGRQAMKSINKVKLDTIPLNIEIYDTYEDTLGDIESPKIKELVDFSLSKLNKNQRRIVELMYYEDISQNEISNIMGFSNSHSIKTQKYKAFKILRETINGKLNGEKLDEYLTLT